MLVSRPPRPGLRPFVRLLWASEPGPGGGPAGREHVLPSGLLHLAVRLSGPALRVFDAAGAARELGHAVVGGARSAFYARECGQAGRAAGALLEPGAALLLFGLPAGELAHRHTRLQDLPDRQHEALIGRLRDARDAWHGLDVLEHELARRLPVASPGLHPAVAQTLWSLKAGRNVEQAVRDSGYSHRHLLSVFRDAVGLAPKEYARVLRLQALLARARASSACWSELALEAGFSDQAHFSREFRRFAGLTPQQWRRAAPTHPNHVPVPPA